MFISLWEIVRYCVKVWYSHVYGTTLLLVHNSSTSLRNRSVHLQNENFTQSLNRFNIVLIVARANHFLTLLCKQKCKCWTFNLPMYTFSDVLMQLTMVSFLLFLVSSVIYSVFAMHSLTYRSFCGPVPFDVVKIGWSILEIVRHKKKTMK